VNSGDVTWGTDSDPTGYGNFQSWIEVTWRVPWAVS